MTRTCKGTSALLHSVSVSIRSLHANLFIDQTEQFLIALLSLSLKTFTHVRAKCSLNNFDVFFVPVAIECEVMKASENTKQIPL